MSWLCIFLEEKRVDGTTSAEANTLGVTRKRIRQDRTVTATATMMYEWAAWKHVLEGVTKENPDDHVNDDAKMTLLIKMAPRSL